MYVLQLFWAVLYSPPRTSHNIFLLQPVLTLFVQSSVIHCIVVSFGQELNIPIFPADIVLAGKLAGSCACYTSHKKKQTQNSL